MDSIKNTLGKLFISPQKINLIIANSPKLYAAIDNLTIGTYYKTLSKLENVFCTGNSLFIHQKVPFVIKKDTVITQDFIPVQAIDCVSGDGETILYFNEYLDDSLFYQNHNWYLLCWTQSIEFPKLMMTHPHSQIYVEEEHLWVKKE